MTILANTTIKSYDSYHAKLILISFLFSILSLAVCSQSDKRLKGIEKEFKSILESTKAAGFGVAIVEGDEIIYAKGFGYRDFENKIAVDANTLFAIGSSSKAFTSALIGLLREEDKLAFDDHPRQYVPHLEFYNNELNNAVTIKDLMQHSTGLPRHDGAWYYFPNKNKDSLVARLQYHEPFTGVREQWYYNNFGFLLQGVITEHITGKSWEENIETKFFKPLGMTRSLTGISGMTNDPNAAIGYTLDQDRNIEKMDYYDISGMSPAGSINSSVNEMSNWLITWINNGKYNENQIIPEAYVKEAISSQMVVAGGTPNKELPNVHFANYGYGWFLRSYKGHYMVEHGGNIDGFSASVGFYPTDSLGVVVLANQNGSAVPSLVRNTVADYMLKLERTNWAKKHMDDMEKALEVQKDANENKELASVKNTRPSHTKLDYTGSYNNDGYGTFEIRLENDSLFTELNGKKQYLNHFHYDTFEMIGYKKEKLDTTEIGSSLKLTFTTNEAGDINNSRLAIEPMTDPIIFKRTPNFIEVDAKTLEKYAGDYDLMGTEIKAYIKDENVLYVFLEGQPEYALLPTALHKFNFKTLEGFKVEFIEIDGEIKEVKFIQPNGVFTAKRKVKD